MTARSSWATCRELRAAQPACIGQLRAKRHRAPEGNRSGEGRGKGCKGNYGGQREGRSRHTEVESFRLGPCILCSSLKHSHQLKLTELQPQEQQCNSVHLHLLSHLEDAARATGMVLRLEHEPEHCSTLTIFKHNSAFLSSLLFFGGGRECFLFLNNTAQVQFVRLTCQMVWRQISCSNANCWNNSLKAVIVTLDKRDTNINFTYSLTGYISENFFLLLLPFYFFRLHE